MLRRNDLIKNHYPIRNSCRGASLESERDNEDAADGFAKSAKNMTNQVYCRISRKTTESVQPSSSRIPSSSRNIEKQKLLKLPK